jgi:hypothetical protein
MSYDTRYALSWSSDADLVTEAWQELVSEVGEEKAQALLDKGLTTVRKNWNASEGIADWISNTDGARFALERSGKSRESCSWYDHEEDMKALAAHFPDILFALEGEGEESGDLWKKYFLGDQMQVCRAIITYDECTLKAQAVKVAERSEE